MRTTSPRPLSAPLRRSSFVEQPSELHLPTVVDVCDVDDVQAVGVLADADAQQLGDAGRDGDRDRAAELGQDQSRQPVQDLLRLQAPGQAGAGGRQDREAVPRLRQLELCLCADGHVVVEQGEAVLVGPDADLEPGVQGGEVVLDRLGCAGGHRALVGASEDAVGQVGHDVVEVAAEQLLPAVSQDPFGVDVDVRDRPLTVDAHERGRHRLHEPVQVVPQVSFGARVVRGADEVRGPAEHVGDGPTSQSDPAVRAARYEDPVLDHELAEAVLGPSEGAADALEIVRVHEAGEGRPGPCEGLGRHGVQLAHATVPVDTSSVGQLVGEGPEVSGVRGEADTQVQTAEPADVVVELSVDERCDVGEPLDVRRGPGPGFGSVHAQRAQYVAVDVGEQRAEVGADQATGHGRQSVDARILCRVVDHERPAAANRNSAQAAARRLLRRAGRPDQPEGAGHHLLCVADETDLGVRRPEELRGEGHQPVEPGAGRTCGDDPRHGGQPARSAQLLLALLLLIVDGRAGAHRRSLSVRQGRGHPSACRDSFGRACTSSRP